MYRFYVFPYGDRHSDHSSVRIRPRLKKHTG